MSTEIASLQFSNGVDVGTPSGLAKIANQLQNFASDADFVTANGTASQGDEYWNTTDSLAYIYDGTAWVQIGSGSGGGGINYILNPDAESNTDGWATYDDGASATPVDGTAGTSANLTLTAQETTVLRGDASFKVAKGAADAQGEGVSYDYTIAKADMLNVLKIEFDYNTDGTYVAGDLAVYIYDVDTSTLITPRTTSITGYDKDNSGSLKFVSDYAPVDVSSTNYRLIFHVTTTSASAYDLYFDSVVVGPDVRSQGAVVGEWENFTPPADASIASYSLAAWRQDGPDIIIRYNFIPANVSNYVTLRMPAGFTHDNEPVIGNWQCFNSAVSAGVGGTLTLYTTDSNAIRLNVDSSGITSGIYVKANDLLTYLGSRSTEVTVRIPVVELAGTAKLNTINDSVVYANARTRFEGYSAGTTPVTNTYSIVKVNNNIYGSATDYDSSTGAYTAPADGIYDAVGFAGLTSQHLAGGLFIVMLKKNDLGTTTAGVFSQKWMYGQRFGSTGGTINLLKGDTISMHIYSVPDITPYTSATSELTSLTVTRISDYSAGSVAGFGLADADNAGLVTSEKYEKLTGVTVSGGSGTGGTFDLTFQRTGKLVTMHIDLFTGTGTTAAATATAGGVIPAWAAIPSGLPSNAIYGQAGTYSFGTNLYVIPIVDGNGAVTVQPRDLDTGAYFAFSASTSVIRFTQSWIVD